MNYFSGMNTNDELSLLFISILFFIITIYLIKRSIKDREINYKIKKTVTSQIKNVKMNQICEVKGLIVNQKNTLISLIRSQECVYYKTIVEQKGRKNRWETILEEEKSIPFLISDGTGEIAIDTIRADLSNLKNQYEHTLGEWSFEKNKKEIPEYLLKFCNLNNIKTNTFFGTKKVIRFKETSLILSSEIYVLGQVKKIKNKDTSSGLVKISRDNKNKIFIVSDHLEKDLIETYSVHFLTIPLATFACLVSLFYIFTLSNIKYYVKIIPFFFFISLVFFFYRAKKR